MHARQHAKKEHVDFDQPLKKAIARGFNSALTVYIGNHPDLVDRALKFALHDYPDDAHEQIHVAGIALPGFLQSEDQYKIPSGVTLLDHKNGIPVWRFNDVMHRAKPRKKGGFTDIHLIDDVAIKTQMKEKYAENEDLPNMLVYLEGETLASLRHPNIINFYGYCTLPDKKFGLVLERVDRTLKEHNAQNNLSFTQILNVAKASTSALLHSHSLGIGHYDIKTDNIGIVNPDDLSQSKLIDF